MVSKNFLHMNIASAPDPDDPEKIARSAALLNQAAKSQRTYKPRGKTFRFKTNEEADAWGDEMRLRAIAHELKARTSKPSAK